MIKVNEVITELIGDRKIFSIDVGDMSSDKAQEYLDNLYDEFHGLEIGSSYKQHKVNKLYLNISIGFAIVSFLLLTLTKYYYGVL